MARTRWSARPSTASASTCGCAGRPDRPGPAGAGQRLELAAVPALADGTAGWLLGDRNYHAPRLSDELAGRGLRLPRPIPLGQPGPTSRRGRTCSAAFAIGSTPSSGSSSTAIAPSASGRVTPITSAAASSARCSATLSRSTSPSRPSIRRYASPTCSLPDKPAHRVRVARTSHGRSQHEGHAATPGEAVRPQHPRSNRGGRQSFSAMASLRRAGADGGLEQCRTQQQRPAAPDRTTPAWRRDA